MRKTWLILLALLGFVLAVPVAAIGNPADEQYVNPITSAAAPPQAPAALVTTTTTTTPIVTTPAAPSSGPPPVTTTTTTTTTTTPTTAATTTTSAPVSPPAAGPPPPPQPASLTKPSTTQTLPFTGLDLLTVVLAGGLLLGLGLTLRRLGGRRTS